MYDIWVNQENPSLHLVLKQGTPLPDATPMVNWSRLGATAVTPEVAATVEREGRAEVISIVPFDPGGVFGRDGAPSGGQLQMPR